MVFIISWLLMKSQPPFYPLHLINYFLKWFSKMLPRSVILLKLPNSLANKEDSAIWQSRLNTIFQYEPILPFQVLPPNWNFHLHVPAHILARIFVLLFTPIKILHVSQAFQSHLKSTSFLKFPFTRATKSKFFLP